MTSRRLRNLRSTPILLCFLALVLPWLISAPSRRCCLCASLTSACTFRPTVTPPAMTSTCGRRRCRALGARSGPAVIYCGRPRRGPAAPRGPRHEGAAAGSPAAQKKPLSGCRGPHRQQPLPLGLQPGQRAEQVRLAHREARLEERAKLRLSAQRPVPCCAIAAAAAAAAARAARTLSGGADGRRGAVGWLHTQRSQPP